MKKLYGAISINDIEVIQCGTNLANEYIKKTTDLLNQNTSKRDCDS